LQVKHLPKFLCDWLHQDWEEITQLFKEHFESIHQMATVKVNHIMAVKVM
jgi:hypothetical protein